MPAITDKACKVAIAGSETTLASPGKALGAASIKLADASGWPTATGIIFAMRRVDNKGIFVPGTYTEWGGVLAGDTISGLTGTPLFGTDQPYAADGLTQVYLPVSASLWNRLIDLILAQHNQDGTHGVITTPNLTVTGPSTFSQNPVFTGGLSSLLLSNPYKFSVYRNAAWTQNNGAQKVPFETEEYDTGNNYDVTNFRFVAPVNGFYHFDAIAGCAENGTGITQYTSLYKNGAELKRGVQNQTGAPGGAISSQVSANPQLTAGDVIEVYSIWSGSSVSGAAGAGITEFSGYLISKT